MPILGLRTLELLVIGGDLCLLGRLAMFSASIVKKEVLKAVWGSGTHFGVYFKHVLEQVLEKLVRLAPLVTDKVVKEEHLFDILPWRSFLSGCWPSKPHLMSLNIHFFLFVSSTMKLMIDLAVVTLLRHVNRYGATLLLDHSEML